MDSLPLAVQPPRRTLRARLVRCGVMLVIFLAGGVAGYSVGVGTMQWSNFDTAQVKVMTEPSKFTEFLLAQLKKDLVLNDAQYPEDQKILVRHHEGFDKIRRQTQPLFDKQMATLEREMQAVLTPTQWTRYKGQLEWMKKRHSRPSNGGSPRPPGKEGFRGPSAGLDSGPGRRDHGPGPHPAPGPGRNAKTSERPQLEQPAKSPANFPLTTPKVDRPSKTSDGK